MSKDLERAKLLEYKASEPPKTSVDWWVWEKRLDALIADAHVAGVAYTEMSDMLGGAGPSRLASRAKREIARRAGVCVHCGQTLLPGRQYSPYPEPVRSPESNLVDAELSSRGARLVEITGELTWKSLGENWTRERLRRVKGAGPSTVREIVDVARVYGVEIN